jgi:hypothetical protein
MKKKPKLRKPAPPKPNKAETPVTVYNRKALKKRLQEYLEALESI